MGHLVMKRRRGEVLWIGEARVHVLDIVGGKVSLDILAPPDVIIRREEEPESIKPETTEAKENQ